MVDREVSDCQVGLANLDCLDELAVLFDRYRQFYGQPSDREGARQFLAERFAADESVVLVAQSGERLVAFVQLYPTFSSVAMRRVWILNDLFVLPQYRRKSIGQQLLSAATEHARKSKAARLVLATQVENTAAKSLYEQDEWLRDTAFDHYTKEIDTD